MAVIFSHLNPFWLYLLLSFLILYTSWTAVCSEISAKLVTAPKEAKLLLWDRPQPCSGTDAVQTGSEHWEHRESFSAIISTSTEGLGVTIHPTAAASTCWWAPFMHFMGIMIQSFPLHFCWVEWAPSLYCQQHEDCNNAIAIFLFPYNGYRATRSPIQLHTKHARVYTLVHMQTLLIQ